MPAPPPPPSPPAIEISPPSFTSVGDAQLAVCGPRSLEVANVATERNTDAGPGMEFGPTEEPGQEQDPILDYEDNYFQDNFSSKGVVFGTVDDVLVAINEYQESSGNVLSTVRTRGNARTFVCISHANCPFCVKFGPMPKQEGIFYKPENCTIRHRGAKVVSSKSGKRGTLPGCRTTHCLPGTGFGAPTFLNPPIPCSSVSGAEIGWKQLMGY
ncbi:hypothetical protein IV203_003937 [Nitzschia inconspicua]|uniref:Uncharacterized protein n=1 Tax=Nitzschia inconspicua TaxID=303405 RepID=A0A9K3PPN9_9STRA|nr:hypothetical protein IV203_008882 [Nitzschia inconspicua]KAG7354581.1 hypothetical protein IV203_003937 [Nitzschia inconspicua]